MKTSLGLKTITLKLVAIGLAVAIALGSMGVTYACYTWGWWNWAGWWDPDKTVSTPDCEITITCLDTDDNEGTAERPQDIAEITAYKTSGDHEIVITVNNAYPGYEGYVDFCVQNTGSRPVEIVGITTDYPNPDYLQIDLIDYGLGTVIQVGETREYRIVIFGIPQLYEVMDRTFTFSIKIEFECELEKRCETAYAYGGSYATCFIEDGFGNWGWTNGPLAPGNYSFDIYADAGQCDLTKGIKVGTLTIEYNGSVTNFTRYTRYKDYYYPYLNNSNCWTITYTMDSGFTLDETHLYVGSLPYPLNRHGVPSVSNGLFQYKNTDDATEHTYYVDDFCGQEIYIIAHAVVCWYE